MERLIHAIEDIDSHIVEALQRAGGGGADGDDLSSRPLLLGDGSQRLQRHLDHLLMHLVTAHGAALDGGKGAGSHMERDARLTDPPLLQLPEHPVGKVQPGGRCGDTPLDPRIDGLVGDEIGRLGVAIEVRRYRQLTHLLEDVGEGAIGIPREANQSVADPLHGERATRDRSGEAVLLPLRRIADHAVPGDAMVRGKGLLIELRLVGVETEDLDARACGAVEDHPRIDHPRVIHHHQILRREQSRQVVKVVLTDRPVRAEVK